MLQVQQDAVQLDYRRRGRQDTKCELSIAPKMAHEKALGILDPRGRRLTPIISRGIKPR